MRSIVSPNGDRSTGCFQLAGRLHSGEMRVGMAWVRHALHELTYGGQALMWWWEASEEPRGFALHLVGGADGKHSSKTFDVAMVSGCARNARLGSAVRQRLKVLVGEVTASPSREGASVAKFEHTFPSSLDW